MITTARFITLQTKYGDSVETEYINVNHIIRMYQEDDDIVVILTNGTNLLVTGITMGHLLDKLNVSNQLHIYNK